MNNLEIYLIFALSTLFSNPFGSFLVIFLSKLTIDLENGIDLNKTSHFKWIYVCVLVAFHLNN